MHPLKKRFTKISLFILISLIIIACNTTKRVANDKRLLTKNEIVVNTKKTNNENVVNQLYQKPNSSLLGYKLRLNLYNLAKQKADSNYHVWLDKNKKSHKTLTNLLSEKQVDRFGKSFAVSGINNFLMKTGEPPVIFDSTSTKKSIKRLQSYYYNNGYFDAKTSYTKDTSLPKKVKLKYNVVLGKAFMIDTIKTSIATPILDSLYKTKVKNSFIKTNNQYKTEDLDQERARITNEFRNNGAFLFQPNYISFNLDTIGNNKKTNVELIIKDFSYRENDTAKTAPFKLYKISKVAIHTDHSSTEAENIVHDSTIYNNFILYSKGKLRYKPKALTDAVFVIKGSLYSDNNSALTTKYLSNLKVFNYPTIQYKIDTKNENSLIAHIYLTPRDKYTFNPSVDFTHSNIQDFGISGNVSLAIRNIFNGAETFDVGFRGNVGASRDLANPNNNFFNISEIGIDSRLNFPRILSPFNTNKIIPKTMLPSTTIAVGFAKQRNIGLDKQNFTSAFTFNWLPTKNTSFRFDIFNIQFVKNVNVSNYFNIYQSSYNALNGIANSIPETQSTYFQDNQLTIENGTNGFITDVLNGSLITNESNIKTVRSIEERRKRLTENNLIFATSLSFTKTTNKGLTDNNFYSIKTKVESAGNLLSILARASKQLKNQGGANTIFEVEFSQYLKTEFEFIKHWDLAKKKVLAVRSFSGIAIPYGNSRSVPFSRSYFSGGSNDNRAWQPYSLGPGKSGGINDFNEANLKIALNAELRFNIFEKFNGALFADAGNIWNVFDDVEEESFKFKGLKSLEELALGTGFGLRYDQGLFVVRLDLGFKTYNPSKEVNEKWFKELNFSKSVINIGINYPF